MRLSLRRAMMLRAGMRIEMRGAVVLGYHDIAPRELIRTHYTVTPELLRRQVSLAKSWGVHFVPMSDLLQRWHTGQSVDGLATIVFDDALVGVHRYGAQILADLEVPAALFPLTQQLGQRPAWWPGSARTLSAREVRELVGLGWEVGSHSRTHPSLPDLDKTQQRSEIIDSRSELQDLTGKDIRYLAYPFGHHDEAVRDICREAGYEAGFTFLNGRITDDLDAFKLPRLTMTLQSSGLRWALSLARTSQSWPDHQRGEVTGDRGG